MYVYWERDVHIQVQNWQSLSTVDQRLRFECYYTIILHKSAYKFHQPSTVLKYCVIQITESIFIAWWYD